MLRVKDWASFQSYKDRSPPWIRLHKKLLDNFEFHSMSVNARALLPMLWLLASEDEDPVSGLLRDSYEKISFRLRMAKKDVESGIKECVASGFLEVISDDKSISYESVTDSSRFHHSETETETETETERAPTQKIYFDFNTGKFENIPSDKIILWKEAYPAVDFQAELRKAAVWLIANPKNKKSNYAKFLNGWLSRAQDKAPKAKPKEAVGGYFGM